jgi:hypothetical protein
MVGGGEGVVPANAGTDTAGSLDRYKRETTFVT